MYVYPLLRNGCEVRNYKPAITRQRHVNREIIVFSVGSVARYYKKEKLVVNR
jgi:hypothetical protein